MILPRKIIAFFCLAVMVMPLCWFLVMELQQMCVQHEMREKLEKTRLITISLPSGQIYWYKKNKEIIVNNQMFDVKEYKVVNGVYILKGLFDYEETAIRKAVAASENSDDKNQLASHIISVIAFHQSKYDGLAPVSFSFLRNHFVFRAPPYKSFSPEIAGPPPKVNVEI